MEQIVATEWPSGRSAEQHNGDPAAFIKSPMVFILNRILPNLRLPTKKNLDKQGAYKTM